MGLLKTSIITSSAIIGGLVISAAIWAQTLIPQMMIMSILGINNTTIHLTHNQWKTIHASCPTAEMAAKNQQRALRIGEQLPRGTLARDAYAAVIYFLDHPKTRLNINQFQRSWEATKGDYNTRLASLDTNYGQIPYATKSTAASVVLLGINNGQITPDGGGDFSEIVTVFCNRQGVLPS